MKKSDLRKNIRKIIKEQVAIASGKRQYKLIKPATPTYASTYGNHGMYNGTCVGDGNWTVGNTEADNPVPCGNNVCIEKAIYEGKIKLLNLDIAFGKAYEYTIVNYGTLGVSKFCRPFTGDDAPVTEDGNILDIPEGIASMDEAFWGPCDNMISGYPYINWNQGFIDNNFYPQASFLSKIYTDAKTCIQATVIPKNPDERPGDDTLEPLPGKRPLPYADQTQTGGADPIITGYMCSAMGQCVEYQFDPMDFQPGFQAPNAPFTSLEECIESGCQDPNLCNDFGQSVCNPVCQGTFDCQECADNFIQPSGIYNVYTGPDMSPSDPGNQGPYGSFGPCSSMAMYTEVLKNKKMKKNKLLKEYNKFYSKGVKNNLKEQAEYDFQTGTYGLWNNTDINFVVSGYEMEGSCGDYNSAPLTYPGWLPMFCQEHYIPSELNDINITGQNIGNINLLEPFMTSPLAVIGSNCCGGNIEVGQPAEFNVTDFCAQITLKECSPEVQGPEEFTPSTYFSYCATLNGNLPTPSNVGNVVEVSPNNPNNYNNDLPIGIQAEIISVGETPYVNNMGMFNYNQLSNYNITTTTITGCPEASGGTEDICRKVIDNIIPNQFGVTIDEFCKKRCKGAGIAMINIPGGSQINACKCCQRSRLNESVMDRFKKLANIKKKK